MKQHNQPGPPPVVTRCLSVVIVSEVCFLRESLAAALSLYPGIDVKAKIGSRAEALVATQNFQPAILLLDVAFSDSFASIAEFTALAPACAVVALAITETAQNVVAWAEAGAAGYVPNTASVDELVARIEQIARGEQTCSPLVTAGLIRRIAESSRGGAASALDAALTRREMEIFDLVGRGLSNKEIAHRLGIGVGTAKSHVHNVMAKLSFKRRGEVIRAHGAVDRHALAPPVRVHF